jgi:hypothetical protein
LLADDAGAVHRELLDGERGLDGVDVDSDMSPVV